MRASGWTTRSRRRSRRRSTGCRRIRRRHQSVPVNRAPRSSSRHNMLCTRWHRSRWGKSSRLPPSVTPICSQYNNSQPISQRRAIVPTTRSPGHPAIARSINRGQVEVVHILVWISATKSWIESRTNGRQNNTRWKRWGKHSYVLRMKKLNWLNNLLKLIGVKLKSLFSILLVKHPFTFFNNFYWRNQMILILVEQHLNPILSSWCYCALGS